MSRLRTKRPPQDTPIETAPEPAKYTTSKGIRKAVVIIPRNLHQEEYLEYLMDPEKMIVLAHGPAGTGKSYLAMLACVKALSEKKVKKIILIRPTVGVDEENLGFLPGTLLEKVSIWHKNLLDVLGEFYSSKDIESLLETETVELTPLMYMRGRNIKDAWVILDEAQGCSINQIKTLFTRLCANSKLIVTGDNAQTDKKTNDNGFLFFSKQLEMYGGSQYISSVEFSPKDIERHPVVSDVLSIFAHGGK